MEARYYQRESVEAVWQHLCNKAGNPVIVLPTGAGKSICIAMLCRDAVQKFAGRVIVLAHRKELLQQNAEKIKLLDSSLDVGLHSAGLNRCQINESIIIAGIQSVYRKAHEFGPRQLVVVDESHLVGSDSESMYQQFFSDLRQINPNLRVVGLTATAFRTGEGRICRPDALFQEICYSAQIRKLIQEGYLSNLVTVPADSTVDTSNLHIRGGEFILSEMNSLFDDDKKIDASCREIIAKTVGRKSTLVFCPGVFHAAKTARRIEELTGEECGLVTGDTLPMERAGLISRFKNGSLKRLCNVDVLTTGFVAPGIDAIAVLRATMSPGLFAQICGRGLRVANEKEDCLILDFGENLKRHGPLDSETFGHQSKGGRGSGKGDAPIKTCPACEEECPISARFCECGWKFPDPAIAKHETNPDGSPIFEADIPATKWIVEEVFVARHKKKNAEPGTPDTLRVDYSCVPVDENVRSCPACKNIFQHDSDFEVIDVIDKGPHSKQMKCSKCDAHVKWVSKTGNLERKTISEWVCLEHEGFARKKAALWWSARSNSDCPDIDGALSLWGRGAVATPTHILTKPQGKFVRIISYELDEKPDQWAEDDEVTADVFDAFDDADLPF